jgi:outer membrane receptor for ferrienterochelin and colicins
MKTDICIGWGVLLCVILNIHSVLAQNIDIKVMDAETGLPMQFAAISFYPPNSNLKHTHTSVTTKEGTFTTQVNLPTTVRISYLGYATITDTLTDYVAKTYSLKLESGQLKDVVVTGQYATTSTANSLYEVKVITPEIMRQKGAVNLQDALSNELNINQSVDPVFGSGISINGISGEGVKIMVDGVPVAGRLEGKVDLSQLNINNIERVEVVEGPLSVMYGTDAMGGVINLITGGLQKEKVKVFAKGYYETVGQYNVDAGGTFRVSNHQLNINAGRYFFDGYSASNTYERYSEWRPKEQYMADLKYTYSRNSFRISVSGSFFREMMLSRGEPKYVADRVTAKDEKFHTFRPRASVNFLYRFKNNSTLDVVGGYSGFFRFWNVVKKDLTNGEETLIPSETQDTSNYHHFMVRPIYSMYTKRMNIGFQFGLDVNHETTTQLRIENGTQQITDAAAFGSMRWTIVEGLVIQPAIRFAYNTRFRSPLVPSFNLKYSYKDIFTLRTSYGLGFRSPSLKELYLDFKDSNHDITGNQNLLPENGHNVQLSFSATVRKGEHKIDFQPSGFFNYINNKIDLKLVPPSPETPPGVIAYQYDNFKRVVTYGGDFTISYTWKRLSASAGALLTQFETFDASIKEDVVKNLSPDANARIGYTIPKAEISVNAFYKYTGQKALFSMNSSISTGFRDAYHTLDITASKNFWKDRIQLTIGGKNLTGVTNIGAQNASGAAHSIGSGNSMMVNRGRTFFAALVLQFAK